MHKIFLIILALFVASTVSSQEKFIGHYEPYIQVEYKLTEKYSHQFLIEERINWFDNSEFRIHLKQLDLAHFSAYKLNDKNSLALGVQYRFEENFGGDDENELRITEEYKFSKKLITTQIQHRVRTEQLITSESTSHRFRYRFGIKHPLNRKHKDKEEIYVEGILETLLTVAVNSAPEYEQRIGAGMVLPLSDFAEIELGAEYRFDDFTKNLGYELFLVTGLNFML